MLRGTARGVLPRRCCRRRPRRPACKRGCEAPDLWSSPAEGTELPTPESAHEAGPFMIVPMLILAALCLLMGLFPEVLLDVIGKAVIHP